MRNRRRSLDGHQADPQPPPGDKPLAVKQREVQFSDFEAVAKLKERCGWGKDSPENWDRLWRSSNPAIAIAKTPLSMGWVLEAGGTIVGYGGSVPLLYHYGDQVLIAAAGTGLVVDPAYRFRSIGLLASFFRQDNVDLFLITSAIESVGTMSRALKAKALPQPDYDTTLFWVLNARHFAKAVIKKFGLTGSLGSLAALMSSFAVRTEITFRSRGPRRIASNLRITEIQTHEIGDDFEALWKRKLQGKPCLLADRSRASLRWHLTIPGSPAQTVVLCCHRDGLLAGYAVIQNLTDKNANLSHCNLIDLLVDGDDANVMESLLAAAYAKARSSGSHVFEVLGFPRQVREILLRWKPYSRQYPACPFLFKAKEPTLNAILEQGDAWYACPFDGDTTLMPY
jgi:hypothetical protein